MIIKYVNGDILTAKDRPGFVAICHQVNCKGVMGAGLALQIKNKYPNLYKRYRKFCTNVHYNPPELTKSPLLGKIQIFYPENLSVSGDSEPTHCIVNCFGQDGYSNKGVQTDYVALKKCFKQINTIFKNKRVALPYKFGCGLAGGDWSVVERLIEENLNDCKIEIWKYNF